MKQFVLTSLNFNMGNKGGEHILLQLTRLVGVVLTRVPIYRFWID